MNTNQGDDLISSGMAAQLLGVNRKTLINRNKDGKFRCLPKLTRYQEQRGEKGKGRAKGSPILFYRPQVVELANKLNAPLPLKRPLVTERCQSVNSSYHPAVARMFQRIGVALG